MGTRARTRAIVADAGTFVERRRSATRAPARPRAVRAARTVAAPAPPPRRTTPTVVRAGLSVRAARSVRRGPALRVVEAARLSAGPAASTPASIRTTAARAARHAQQASRVPTGTVPFSVPRGKRFARVMREATAPTRRTTTLTAALVGTRVPLAKCARAVPVGRPAKPKRRCAWEMQGQMAEPRTAPIPRRTMSTAVPAAMPAAPGRYVPTASAA
jgi:hypothetical protein